MMGEQVSDNAESLYQLGKAALDVGDRALAEIYWQRAAYIAPKDERIWWALLGVAQDDADSRICLENILRINPDSAEAARHLAVLDAFTPAPDVPSSSSGRIILRVALRLLIYCVLLALLFVAGLFLGVMLQTLF